MFDRAFQTQKYDASECTFTNLYMWRNAYDIRWDVVNGLLVTTMTWEGETFFLPPYGVYGDIAGTLQVMLDYCQNADIKFLIKGVCTSHVKPFEEAMPGKLEFTLDRDNYDYVHLTQELIELKGRKYSHKKNHMHYFLNHYSDYQFRQLSSELTPACIEVAREWLEKKAENGEADTFLQYELDSITDCLLHFDELKLRGGAILIGGKVQAFSFGEPLNSEMLVIHTEKANSDIRGLFQVINHDCCRLCWPEFKYVNREEDMGIPGLRKAKESYRPLRLIEKYDVCLKE